MPGPADTESDFAAQTIPPIEATAPDDVRDVEALPGYRLRVIFYNGTTGIVDMAEMIASLSAGVFAALRDPERFAAARIEYGAVTWPGNLDLAPDAMYAELAASAEWRLR